MIDLNDWMMIVFFFVSFGYGKGHKSTCHAKLLKYKKYRLKCMFLECVKKNLKVNFDVWLSEVINLYLQ